MSARKYLKGGALLTGGSIVSSVCSFARNIVIARLLSVEDFGIAAIFVITVSLLERMSYIALDQFLVQTADGDDPKVQAVAQAFQAVRGFVGALLLVIFAGPIAALFGVPEVAWAFQVFAIYPLARGFVHLDMARLQRQMRFKMVVWTDMLPQILTLAVAVPLGLWLGDYRVVLLIYTIQAISYVLASHLMAERAYRWAWEPEILKRMLGFGWPLLINGFLMFGITQGDRAIVGSAFTMEELGWYSAAFSLAMMPSVIGVRVLRIFLLPLLARVQYDEKKFQQRAVIAVHLCTLCGILLGLGSMLAGPGLVLIMYGSRYAEAITVIGWLGLMQGARIAKAGPALAAMARGETTNPLYANIVRCSGLLLAIGAVAAGYGVVEIAISGLIGEVSAFLFSVLLLKLRLNLSVLRMLMLAGVGAVILAAAYKFMLPWIAAMPLWSGVLVGTLSAFLLTGSLILLSPDACHLLRRLVR